MTSRSGKLVFLILQWSCGQPNGARAPSPVTNPLMGGVPKDANFPPIGAHVPFQPTPAQLPASLAGWKANPSPLPHHSSSVGPMSLAVPTNPGSCSTEGGSQPKEATRLKEARLVEAEDDSNDPVFVKKAGVVLL
uniref:Uncharacterized protein n=1 Tax=Kalanchoe fedtschenkoi TaxID=63787 RepID=A0A7N0UQ71_KALFE